LAIVSWSVTPGTAGVKSGSAAAPLRAATAASRNATVREWTAPPGLSGSKYVTSILSPGLA